MSNTDKVKEFYTNDIVYRFDKHKRIVFGVVINSYEASPDVDEYQALQKGQIRVLWSNTSRELVWKQSKVRLMNRNIIPGDIVRRLEKGRETQRGYCKEATQVATVQIVGTDKVIEHVSSERLHNVSPYSIDDAVCLGNKFGRIESIDRMISMQSKCGSIVHLLTSINHDLDDHWLSKRNRLSYDLYQYYPGQELICIPSSLEQPYWVKKTKTMKRTMQARQRFTVQKVEDFLIEVAWYSNSSGYSNLVELPPEEIKKLKVLEHPNDTYLELCDRRLLKLSSGDGLLRKKEWTRKVSALYRPDVAKMRYVVHPNPRPLPKGRPAPVALPPPTVDAAPSTPLDPEKVEGEEEEEEEWWTEEGGESEEGGAPAQKSPQRRWPPVALAQSPPKVVHYPPKGRDLLPGRTVPVEVICVESKVTVVWQDGTEEKDIPSTQLYYSISLDDHEFFPGEWVVNDNAEDENDKYGVVQSVNYLERTAKIKWFTYSEAKKVPEELAINEMSVYDLKKHSKFVFRPRSIVKSKPDQNEKMGKVIDSCIEGYVKVRWLDSAEEHCWPQDIEAMPETDEYDFSDEESSTGGAAAVSWETESVESYAGDLSDETVLQNMAARLDFVRNRIVYLRDAFRRHTITENFSFLKDLLLVYENSSYLDKLLGTSFFSLKSRHFQALLHQAKEKAKALGVELRGRLFCGDPLPPSVSKTKMAEKENINKMIKLENKINAQIEKKEGKEALAPGTTPLTPDSAESAYLSPDNLCVELLSMLQVRMDLAYAEIVSRIGGRQALTVLTRASERAGVATPMPACPATPDESLSPRPPLPGEEEEEEEGEEGRVEVGGEAYCVVEEAPASHHYAASKFEPTDLQRFLKAVQKEQRLLSGSLPAGVWVRSYGDRLDLLSAMIRGPANTPYEDGLFLFDIQLGGDYPRSPPLVHFISYSTERLNPNLYVEGKVCVSLLGTWMGRGTEVWGPKSTLLQLIVSIQGLILVSEPYYNEAGYEKQNDTQQGYENSRTYNELVILKMVQSTRELLRSPPEVFKAEIHSHFARNGPTMCDRLSRYCNDSDPSSSPEFALLPVSKGLKLSLSAALAALRAELTRMVGDATDK